MAYVRATTLRLLGVLLGVALLVAACSSTATPAASAAGSAPSGAGGTVTIQNLAFGPTTLTIAAGTTVTWTNKDSVQHTVTADDGSFDSGKLASGSTFSQTFSKPGTYAYHCTIHSSMKATITVS
jgi:plastocyanin